MGSIVVKLPLPPSCLPTLWQQDERFKESYLAEFPGYYKTADAGFKDEDGYLFIMGRTDDIINVAGHRLSTGGMEEVLVGPPGRRRMRRDRHRGRAQGRGAVRLHRAEGRRQPRRPPRSRRRSSRWCARRSARSRRSSSPSRCARLPKTRSGKILRGTMKKIADGESLDHAGDDRGSEGARRDRRGAEGEGNRNIERSQFAKAKRAKSKWEGCHAHHSILRRLAWAFLHLHSFLRSRRTNIRTGR